MAHDHHHDDATYYQEQLWTIGVCGMLAVVAILMWYLGRLDLMLVKQFHLPVLIAGIGLLVLVVIRGVTLWIAVGKSKHAHAHDHAHHHDHAHSHEHVHDHAHSHEHVHAPVTAVTAQQPAAASHVHSHGHVHDHDHEHGPCCGHDHAHDQHQHGITTTPTSHTHTHDGITTHPAPAAAAAVHGHTHAEDDHGHSHTWNPVRYIVLLLPIVLFLLKLPNEGFSSTNAIRHGGGWSEVDSASVKVVETKGDQIMRLAFKELKQAASNPRSKEHLEGRIGEIKGQFMPGPNDKTFTLVRYKMNCCAADAIKLDVLIVCEESISGYKPNDWVAVEGQIQFLPRKDGNGFSPVLVVPSRTKVVAIQAEANPYEQ